MFRGLGSCTLSRLTATAGTAITALIPPRARAFARLIRLLYRCGGTAHVVTVLKTLGTTTLASGVAASGTSVTLSADPGTGTPAGNIANGDYVAIALDNGDYFLATVASLSTLTFTSGAFPSAAAAGNKVVFFGAPGDHTSSQTTVRPNPKVGSQFLCTASALNDWSDFAGGICQTLNQEEALLIHVDNLTAAGTLELASAAYTLN